VAQAKNFHLSIHVTLKRLIDEKSVRDDVKFTACQLAAALDMPRSMITKLTHADKSKRVSNPRVDTLIKIAEFFRADGFDVTLDDLIGIKSTAVGIDEQVIPQENSAHHLPVYTFNAGVKRFAGAMDVKVQDWNDEFYGVRMDDDIPPYFKSGSVIILNPKAQIEFDNLIAVMLPDSKQVQLKKYCQGHHKIILKSLDSSDQDIILMPTSQYEILGVVVQINART
jgi:hypothetical protein